MKYKLLSFVFAFAPGIVLSQPAVMERPAIWGIAKLTFLVTDFQLARDYYGKFLGFTEAFSYPSDLGEVISFKINDRQFLEFVKDSDAKNKNRLVSVSLETDHVEQMRQYLKSHGIDVPERTQTDGAGNEVIRVEDPSGNPIEFISFGANGLHRQSEGLYLSERRISKRIHHVGLYAEIPGDQDPFYSDILKFVEIMRYPENRDLPPTLLYFGMKECTESIEHYFPADRDFSHPCFLVDDMQETIYALHKRRGNELLEKPVVGKSNRWILNLRNADGTRIEFTEAHTIR